MLDKKLQIRGSFKIINLYIYIKKNPLCKLSHGPLALVKPCVTHLCVFVCVCQHGRVKLKSTAQQEEEKRKEREKKLKAFVSARDAVLKKVCSAACVCNECVA